MSYPVPFIPLVQQYSIQQGRAQCEEWLFIDRKSVRLPVASVSKEGQVRRWNVPSIEQWHHFQHFIIIFFPSFLSKSTHDHHHHHSFIFALYLSLPFLPTFILWRLLLFDLLSTFPSSLFIFRCVNVWRKRRKVHSSSNGKAKRMNYWKLRKERIKWK